jgi:hypothetical protein
MPQTAAGRSPAGDGGRFVRMTGTPGVDSGRAYCLNIAPSAEHVRRAHEQAGFPFEPSRKSPLFFEPSRSPEQ